MPQRLRLYDWRVSGGPADVGICQSDLPDAANVVNAAQRRLISAKEAGDEGWWGTWAEMAFTMSRTQPYITTPREVARIEAAQVCTRNIPMRNQFFEYMQFGNGRLPKMRPCSRWPLTAAYTRNTVPTFTDMTSPPQYIAVYATDVTDIESIKRVLVQGTDQNGNIIYTMDNGIQVNGMFLNLVSPFVLTPMLLGTLTGLQKDVTAGQVQFWQLDPTTGAQILLHTMEPGETSASYRRYYFDSLPLSCCPPVTVQNQIVPINPLTSTVSVTAIAKLEPIAVVADTDYLTLQGEGVLEAITDEAMAIRYMKIDSPEAKQMARERHQSAISLLNGILNHYIGKNSIAVQFKPFGTAELSHVGIGMI